MPDIFTMLFSVIGQQFRIGGHNRTRAKLHPLKYLLHSVVLTSWLMMLSVSKQR